MKGFQNKTQFNNDKKLNIGLVTKNYDFFINTLKTWPIDDLIDLFNYYYNNFIISCIKFEDEKVNEMEIFENLNSKGKDLDTFDMIKNYIFTTVKKNVFEENTSEITKEFNWYFNFNRITSLKGKNDEQAKNMNHFYIVF
ncbi:hypothetical protein SCLARK_001349 [Spiroplasma clarkii]|uniref:DUF262 domain-containing protein n=1 Tax=Spiroplasma clarkii TaxID=2139 RepID=UPI000B57595E|nr:DUF262 domain-containing protein [Spiroplasma clarkii]ARU91880.1 hypothetical protein SCLARK_001349 [Spiroplasma clarkii]